MASNPYRLTFTSPMIEEVTYKQGTLVKLRTMLVNTNNGALVNDATVVATPGNGDPAVTLQSIGGGMYQGYWPVKAASNSFAVVAVAQKMPRPRQINSLARSCPKVRLKSEIWLRTGWNPIRRFVCRLRFGIRGWGAR
jgi:hypothetical protein